MANEELKRRNLNFVLHTASELFMQNGIENTTQAMLVRASGVSRASLDRYFTGKADCVLQTAEYIGLQVRERLDRMDEAISSGKQTGIQLLEQYLREVKALFIDNSLIFVLIVELEAFVFRNSDDYTAAFQRLSDALGNHSLLERIFAVGEKDGSIKRTTGVKDDISYLSEFYRCLLSNFALTEEPTSPEHLSKISRFIDRVLLIYRA